ncbi:MAG TPA: endo-1,4-beta-xylanase [Gemmatimonadaceae bacterium]|jgi:endo-1,4-beta-xylanase
MRSWPSSCRLLSALAIVACSSQQKADGNLVAPIAAMPLKAAFADAFVVGAAINDAQFTGRDPRGAQLIAAQFNTVTPENVLKWENVHPSRGKYVFAPGDAYVDFGTKNKMAIIGHTLVWHSQTPSWVFNDQSGKPLGREALLAVMRDHIMTVVGRYKRRIKGWDVVNEALNEDGSLRQSSWYRGIGEDYLVKAFQYAHEADPSAELYYNDYSLENGAKRNGAVRLIQMLQKAGVKVSAIGTQSHVKMDWPSSAQYDSTLNAFAALGVHVNVTELDVDVLPPATRGQGADVATRGAVSPMGNPWPTALPDSMQRALAHRYADLFRVFVAHRDVIDRVTFWGVGDGDSWLNNWPVRGRTSYPLLFDRSDQPKPALDSVLATAAHLRQRD